ncbi:unnamed protein product [Menidia menidia]|uniref:(Atlantic silverside) hypothetical protein n=1 Tax=Menidia menidia TaxID=238744 RepID=A0A8S4AW08_9TELE|nr:unnamed protein product [Menidia menidia]
MENSNNDVVLLHCSKLVTSEGMDVGARLEPEQELSGPPEASQETAEAKEGSPTLADIELRIQHLQTRRILLQTIQNCTKKQAQSFDENRRETSSEDGEEECELETIEKELEELRVKKKEMEKNRIPRGGIYILPPLLPDLNDNTAATTDPVVAVENLGPTAQVTKCPTCKEVIVTETGSKISEAAWMVCVLSFMMGCVAGCCLIPFYLKRFRSTCHKCPLCQAHIHTHQPL